MVDGQVGERRLHLEHRPFERRAVLGEGEHGPAHDRRVDGDGSFERVGRVERDHPDVARPEGARRRHLAAPAEHVADRVDDRTRPAAGAGGERHRGGVAGGTTGEQGLETGGLGEHELAADLDELVGALRLFVTGAEQHQLGNRVDALGVDEAVDAHQRDDVLDDEHEQAEALQHRGERLVVVVRRDRHRHPARRLDGQVELEPGGAVGDEQPDACAVADAAPGQCDGQRGDAVGELAGGGDLPAATVVLDHGQLRG